MTRCSDAASSIGGEVAPVRGEREEIMLVGLTRILLSQKIKKIHTVDSAATNIRYRF
jgi:hypothetical protein